MVADGPVRSLHRTWGCVRDWQQQFFRGPPSAFYVDFVLFQAPVRPVPQARLPLINVRLFCCSNELHSRCICAPDLAESAGPSFHHRPFLGGQNPEAASAETFGDFPRPPSPSPDHQVTGNLHDCRIMCGRFQPCWLKAPGCAAANDVSDWSTSYSG